MELTGTLHAFPLTELLDMLQASSMCGVLEVDTQHGRGTVYVREGQIYHAVCGDMAGNAALWCLFEETAAPFAIRANVVADCRTISGDLAYLVEEGQRRAALWSQVRQQITNFDLVPTLRRDGASQHAINEEDWPVFTAIDGTRTIREIATHLSREPLDVCCSLVRLLNDAVVVCAAAEPHHRSSAASDQAGGLLKRSGVATPLVAPVAPTSQQQSRQPDSQGLFQRLRRAWAPE